MNEREEFYEAGLGSLFQSRDDTSPLYVNRCEIKLSFQRDNLSSQISQLQLHCHHSRTDKTKYLVVERIGYLTLSLLLLSGRCVGNEVVATLSRIPFMARTLIPRRCRRISTLQESPFDTRNLYFDNHKTWTTNRKPIPWKATTVEEERWKKLSTVEWSWWEIVLNPTTMFGTYPRFFCSEGYPIRYGTSISNLSRWIF